MVDRITKEHRSWNMSRIKGSDTKPEKILRSALHRAGFRFRLHHPKLPGRPDIVLPKYQTAVFVHGCYWHRHANCPKTTTPKTRTDFWQAKFDGTVERDRRNVDKLTRLGWHVITVWECELEKNPDDVLQDIDKRLKEKCNGS